MKIYQWCLLGIGVLFLPVFLAPILPDRPETAISDAKSNTPVVVSEPSAADKKDFAENRDIIMSWLREMNEKGNFTAAVEWGKRFSGIDDPEFQELYSQSLAGKGHEQTRQTTSDEGRTRREKQFKKSISSSSSSSAQKYCESSVKAQLKSPSTAKFEFGPRVTHNVADFSYEISSHVDSQNSFGGTVRTHYRCKLEFINGKDWNIIDISLSE